MIDDSSAANGKPRMMRAGESRSENARYQNNFLTGLRPQDNASQGSPSQRVAALRFGTTWVMQLLMALGCAGLCFGAFSNRDVCRVRRWTASTRRQSDFARQKPVEAEGTPTDREHHELDELLERFNRDMDALATHCGRKKAA